MADKTKYTDKQNFAPGLIPHEAERRYALDLAKAKKDYIYQPTVRLLAGIIYHPDFYLVADDVYVEIVGTRQAYHIAKRKIQLFHREFGEDKLLVLKGDGKPYYPVPNQSQIDAIIERISKRREDNVEISPENIRDLRIKLGLRRNEWAKLIGVKHPPSTLYWEKGGGRPGRRVRKILLAIMREHEIAKRCPHCNSIYFEKAQT